MKKKGLTAVTLFVAVFLVIWFIPVHNRKEEPEKGEYQRIGEIPEAETKAGEKAEEGEALSAENGQ